MDWMDWSDWSFWQWLGTALTLVVTAIGIKFAVTFDLNRYLEWRKKAQKRKLTALCPHTELRLLESGEILVESRFHRPMGTTAYICGQCGLVVHDQNTALRISQNWASNLVGWMKADKRFRKAYDKFYGI